MRTSGSPSGFGPKVEPDVPVGLDCWHKKEPDADIGLPATGLSEAGYNKASAVAGG
jgi:hypothetical protein